MSFEKAKQYLDEKGFGGHIIVPEKSSATVQEAAEALGVAPGQIAKTLSFLVNDQPVLILAEGMARIDNKKYKAVMGCKAKMIPGDQVERLTGHEPGGVCPFGILPGIRVFLDESLKQHEIVYPAAGSGHSAVKLTIEELEEVSGFERWIDVCKAPSEGGM